MVKIPFFCKKGQAICNIMELNKIMGGIVNEEI
jgi:hypothetical protein